MHEVEHSWIHDSSVIYIYTKFNNDNLPFHWGPEYITLSHTFRFVYRGKKLEITSYLLGIRGFGKWVRYFKKVNTGVPYKVDLYLLQRRSRNYEYCAVYQTSILYQYRRNCVCGMNH